MMWMRRAMAMMVFCVAPAAFAAPLRSPWDARVVAVKDASYSCPALQGLPKDIEASDYYSDAKHSVIDEKRLATYRAVSGQFDDAIKAASKAADVFQVTGNRSAAACVLTILDAEAANAAMSGAMSTNQANYLQAWTLGGLAVDWLKVRQAEPGTAAQRKAATDWMAGVGAQVKDWSGARHQRGTKDGSNNHYYWAGFTVAGAGIAADDRKLYEWGIGTYDAGLSNIKPDGTLPLEMDRGQRALHYHLFAIVPLVMLAEFGEANGRAMYSADHGALRTLADRAIAGLGDSSYFAKAAGAPQDTPDGKAIKSTDVIWMVTYLKRFPDAAMQKVLDSADLKPYNYIGGWPPGWTK